MATFDGMEWTPTLSRDLSKELLGRLPDRWRHVQGVATASTMLGCPDRVLSAAWLHDIGYADEAVHTGMHAVDGAEYLKLHGAPKELVSLVAFHTGAEFEAEERGLLDRLLPFDPPDQDELDLLILADLTTSPTGERVPITDRIDEIFDRYETQDPVHRAVSRSRGYLWECCRRAAVATGYPM